MNEIDNPKGEVLPCPFCGNPPEVRTGGAETTVFCWGKDEACGHRGIMMGLEEWQTRKPNQSCPYCHGDREVAEIAKKMGFRPDVAFARVRKLENMLAEQSELNNLLRDIAANDEVVMFGTPQKKYDALEERYEVKIVGPARLMIPFLEGIHNLKV